MTVVYDIPASKFGDLFTIEDFGNLVKVGAFISDDGVGYFGTESHYTYDHDVFTTLRGMGRRPAGSTHIHWFNK